MITSVGDASITNKKRWTGVAPEVVNFHMRRPVKKNPKTEQEERSVLGFFCLFISKKEVDDVKY